jgi:uncharacterized protein (TIGR02266 family)
MAEQRKDSRSAASLKVKYKSSSVDEFVQQFGTDVSRSGIFIKTKSPLEAGALLKLELQLSTAAAVIAGIGRVAWRRAASVDPARPAGMGIKFIKLEPASQTIVDRIVTERGAHPSRFDQNEGAELARASLEPPAPTSLPPDRTSSPGADAPVTVRPPAPVVMPPVASKPLVSKPVAAAPAAKPAAAPIPAPAPVPTASAVAMSSASATAASRPRIGPTKAAIPSGLFANSPLVQPTPSTAPIEEKRTSFFPPAPSMQPAAARGGSNASGPLSASRSSSGSTSSPLHRPGNSRAPSSSLSPRAPIASGPKGVFGGPAPASPLANRTSGMLRPAKEVSSISQSSILPDRSADEVPTAAVPRPPGGRASLRAQPSAPVAASSVLDSLSSDLFDEAPDNAAASVDGMFATLEPVDGLGDEPRVARQSSPAIADRISPAPVLKNGDATRQRGLGDAEAADVDNLFADLEGNDDATTDEVQKPSASSAGVFTPGSTRPSFAPIADDLAADDAFGEADLLSGEDKGAPPLDVADDEEEDDDDDVPGAIGAASEPPMLRLAEPQAETKPEPKRSPGMMIGLAVVALLVIVGGALAFLKPQLLVQMGLVEGEPPVAAPPAAPEVPVEVPAQPMIEPPSAAAAAAPTPVEPSAGLPAGETIAVNVTSLPRGADVRVAGVLKSQTPTHVDLPLGREVNVTVSAQGHAAQAKLVTARPGMDPLRYKLDPLPYVLVVKTSPREAQLEVGSVTSIAPAPLALGHVSSAIDLTVKKDGYRRMTRSVRLEEFVERDGVLRAEIEVSLSPMPGVEAEAAAPTEPAVEAEPAPSSSSSSSRRRRSSRDRALQGAPAPPEPEAEAATEAAADPKPEPAAEPEAAPEPAKEPGAPPPPPALPSLP